MNEKELWHDMRALLRRAAPFGLIYLMVWLPLGCQETIQQPRPAEAPPGFGKWELPQRQWDNTWTQTRLDTNTGYAEMRVVLKH